LAYSNKHNCQTIIGQKFRLTTGIRCKLWQESSPALLFCEHLWPGKVIGPNPRSSNCNAVVYGYGNFAIL